MVSDNRIDSCASGTFRSGRRNKKDNRTDDAANVIERVEAPGKLGKRLVNGGGMIVDARLTWVRRPIRLYDDDWIHGSTILYLAFLELFSLLR